MKKAFKVFLLWCLAVYILCGVYIASTHVNHEPSVPSFIKRDTAIRLAKIKKENEAKRQDEIRAEKKAEFDKKIDRLKKKMKLRRWTRFTAIDDTKYFKTDHGEVKIIYFHNGVRELIFKKNKDDDRFVYYYNNDLEALKDAAKKLKVKVDELSARGISYLNSEYIKKFYPSKSITKYFKTKHGEVKIVYSLKGIEVVFETDSKTSYIQRNQGWAGYNEYSAWSDNPEQKALATAAKRLKVKISDLPSIETDIKSIKFFWTRHNRSKYINEYLQSKIKYYN